MNVGELIKALSGVDPFMQVVRDADDHEYFVIGCGRESLGNPRRRPA